MTTKRQNTRSERDFLYKKDIGSFVTNSYVSVGIMRIKLSVYIFFYICTACLPV